MMRGLEPEQLHAMCANSLQGWGKWKCHDVDVGNRREVSLCMRIFQDYCRACVTSVADGLVGI